MAVSDQKVHFFNIYSSFLTAYKLVLGVTLIWDQLYQALDPGT